MEEDRKWSFSFDLEPIIGKTAYIETGDGSYREGVITEIDLYVFKINGEDTDIPIALELNGDPGDRIEFRQIRDLTLR